MAPSINGSFKRKKMMSRRERGGQPRMLRRRPPTSRKLVSHIPYLFVPTAVWNPSLLKLTLSALSSPAPLLPGSLLLPPTPRRQYCKTVIASENFKITVTKRANKYFKQACILFQLYFRVSPQNVKINSNNNNNNNKGITWIFEGLLFICARVVSFAARAQSARAADDTYRIHIFPANKIAFSFIR